MKYVSLPIVDLDNGKLDYRKQLIHILEVPIGGQGGVNVGEMYKLFGLLDKLNKLEESPTGVPVLALENDDWQLLNARVQAYPWPRVHRVFATFCEAIEKAPNNKPKPKSEKIDE